MWRQMDWLTLIPHRNALQLSLVFHKESTMTPAAERMRAMRDRRRSQDLREVRLSVPDPRARAVQKRLAAQVEALKASDEIRALAWIEAVSEFDAPATPDGDAAR